MMTDYQTTYKFVGQDVRRPQVPQNITIVGGTPIETTLDLSWDVSWDNIGVTGYRIFRDGIEIGTSPTNSYTDSNLDEATLFVYTITAFDTAGNESRQSIQVEGITLDTIPPLQPQNVTVVTGSDPFSILVISWDPAFDTGGIGSYEIFNNGVSVAIVDGSTLSYEMIGLAKGTQVSITIGATDKSGNIGSLSDPVINETDSIVMANIVPINFTDNCSISIYGGTGFQIIWGDGVAINYSPGNPALVNSIPSGDIIIRNTGNISRIRFTTDTYSEIDLVDSSTLTNMDSMCAYLNNLTTFNASDTSNVTDFRGAWAYCLALTSFPLIDTSSGTDFAYTWTSCGELTAFPLLDFSNATLLANAWTDCYQIAEFPQISLGNVTNLNDTWRNNNALTSFPLLDFSNVTSLSQTWMVCRGLTSFPAINTPNVTSWSSTWLQCTSLVTVGQLDWSSATGIVETWKGCIALERLPNLNTDVCTHFKRAFSGCESLRCLTAINTTNVDNSTTFGSEDMFLGTTSLIDPTASEQTQIMNGLNYVNLNPC